MTEKFLITMIINPQFYRAKRKRETGVQLRPLLLHPTYKAAHRGKKSRSIVRGQNGWADDGEGGA